MTRTRPASCATGATTCPPEATSSSATSAPATTRRRAEAEKVLQQTFGRGRWRTDAEIASLLDGLEILDPGIVPASLWRPDETDNPWNSGGRRELTVWEHLIAAGLARKA